MNYVIERNNKQRWSERESRAMKKLNVSVFLSWQHSSNLTNQIQNKVTAKDIYSKNNTSFSLPRTNTTPSHENTA